MANIVIYYQAIDNATFTISLLGEAAGYPDDNLNDRNHHVAWKAVNANTSGYIQIDLGSARACDYVILCQHNYTDTAYGIKLAYDSADDPGFAGITYKLGSAVSYHNWDSSKGTNWIETFTSVTKRYWRLYFEAMGAGTYQQLATLFIGARWSWAHGPELVNAEDSGYLVTTGETTGGMKRTQINNTTIQRIWEYTQKLVTPSEKTKFENWRAGIYMGKSYSHYPFFFSPDNGTNIYYVRAVGKLKLQESAYQAWETKITLEEEL